MPVQEQLNPLNADDDENAESSESEDEDSGVAVSTVPGRRNHVVEI